MVEKACSLSYARKQNASLKLRLSPFQHLLAEMCPGVCLNGKDNEYLKRVRSRQRGFYRAGPAQQMMKSVENHSISAGRPDQSTNAIFHDIIGGEAIQRVELPCKCVGVHTTVRKEYHFAPFRFNDRSVIEAEVESEESLAELTSISFVDAQERLVLCKSVTLAGFGNMMFAMASASRPLTNCCLGSGSLRGRSGVTKHMMDMSLTIWYCRGRRRRIPSSKSSYMVVGEDIAATINAPQGMC